jgi:hypothetical protein
VYFAGVKFAGYAAAGRWINRRLDSPKPRPVVFGLARTALGLAVGVAFAMSALKLGLDKSMPLFYIALAPIRFGEWLVILALFYARSGVSASRWLTFPLAGTAWSFILDLPAIYAVFALPGGAWIC